MHGTNIQGQTVLVASFLPAGNWKWPLVWEGVPRSGDWSGSPGPDVLQVADGRPLSALPEDTADVWGKLSQSAMASEGTGASDPVLWAGDGGLPDSVVSHSPRRSKHEQTWH